MLYPPPPIAFLGVKGCCTCNTVTMQTETLNKKNNRNSFFTWAEIFLQISVKVRASFAEKNIDEAIEVA